MWWIRQISTPLRYWSIRQKKPDKKLYFDLYLPLIFGFSATLVCHIFDLYDAILSEGGVYSNIVGILELLAAFFIAALAAVSTFLNPSVDEYLRGNQRNPLTIPVWVAGRGEFVRVLVTRRQFLCHMFGYLSFISIIFIAAVNIATFLISSFRLPFGQGIVSAMNFSLAMGFWTIVANIFFTTLMGLSFLTDRLHGPTEDHYKKQVQENDLPQ